MGILLTNFAWPVKSTSSRVQDTTNRIHFARSPGTPQPPNSQLTQDACRPRRSVSQWRRPARAALLQRELASCILCSFSPLQRAVLAVSFLLMSNKKPSWAGACFPACKRGYALLVEDFANNALDCLFVRSHSFQLDSRREPEANSMGSGDA